MITQHIIEAFQAATVAAFFMPTAFAVFAIYQQLKEGEDDNEEEVFHRR